MVTRAGGVLLLRAVVAFAALPGVVAYAVPLAIIFPAGQVHLPWGLLLVAAGTAVLVWCVVVSARDGHRTLAPSWPPQQLVNTGPFAVSRHPMYLTVVAIIAGWAITYASGAVAVYLLLVAIAVSVRSTVEDRQLAGRFGTEWDAYADRVPRWL